MERIGFDGFNWEEVEVDKTVNRGRKDDMYLYLNKGLKQTYIRSEHLEKAGIAETDRLQLLAQGDAILMFKVQKGGAIGISSIKGKYTRLGNADLTSKLHARFKADRFEVIEAADQYILLRPIRE